ncbi:hypothetical protein ACIQKE_30450 [Streptomyces griseoviridis]|uniref:Uncharacterized protein n=1 Tax=Streptomyces hintoniae TaxID=3075521 RepID=A0ABU2UMM7_9ACTN|nr:hypothetical protein [Streptomyces sp. DSM 41014]MDT0474373.1 hypothetical protein [Streptomyces sp. DSM 41014]
MTFETIEPPESDEARVEPGEPDGLGRVEVRIVSADAEAARNVADALRLLFAGGEQRSYPAGPSGHGTRLHLTLDAAQAARAAGPLRSWLDSSRPTTDRTHADETA